MSKILSQTIQDQLSTADIKVKFRLYINNIDYSDYLISWSISYSMEYGSASANFTLMNNEGIFGEGGQNRLRVGDIVSFSEYFDGDVTEFPKFYGILNQRSIVKSADSRQIQIVCLDYISVLQFWDIDFDAEGTKVEVTDELLTPHQLPAPNEALAQVFDFANNNIAPTPVPTFTIVGKTTQFAEIAFDGFEIHNAEGQVKLGFPINTLYNYEFWAKSYYFYTQGLYVEDIIEQLLTKPNGYGKYLFNETSAQDVIDNHLTTTFNATEARNTDYLIPNYTLSTIIIKHQLAQAYSPDSSGYDPTKLYLDSVDGLPASGTASINGDTFTWSSIESGNVLAGIPTTGTYALKAHAINSYLSYETDYAPGTVWYLSYSNVLSDLDTSDFTIPDGAIVTYFDTRYGRIILDKAISLTSIVTCNTNYTFKTLQATGIEINYIQFRSREIDNRMEALKKLFEYLAPNYSVRTLGDAKIWSSYLYQKVTEDYTLQLATQLNYLEDEDLYTRTVFYGKNNNPRNLMFGDGVAFATTGNPYKAMAANTELTLLSEEDGYYVYGINTAVSSSGQRNEATRLADVAINEDVTGIAWANPDNARRADEVGAVATFPANPALPTPPIYTYPMDSDRLIVKGFNFAIPTDVTINGITVNVNKRGSVKDKNVSLVLNGSLIGDNKAVPVSWSGTYSIITYGAPTDTWGYSILPEHINSAEFGVSISCTGNEEDTADVDYVMVIVSYSVGGSSSVSSIGKITTNTVLPIIYVNGVPIDNQAHKIIGQQVILETTTRTESSSGGGGGCFITTAASDFFGKDDNCYELATLREFRDMWLKKESDGQELVARYYKIAPAVVDSINEHSQKERIYTIIWNAYILPCVKLIEEKKYKETKDKYITGVSLLLDLENFLLYHKDYV